MIRVVDLGFGEVDLGFGGLLNVNLRIFRYARLRIG